MSLVERLHQEHKDRLARISMRARMLLRAADKPVPVAAPAEHVVAPVSDALFVEAWRRIDTVMDGTVMVGTVHQIQKAVCREYDVRRTDMLSARRVAKVVEARQVAMYLVKTLTLRSLPDIGRRFGGRDHTTVLHAVRKVARLMSENSEYADRVNRLQRDFEAEEA